MTQVYKYRSPATPGNPAFDVDLGNQAVRLADIPGLITHAELGVVGVSSLRFDDPTGTAGHDGDAVIGLKQLSVFETSAPSLHHRVWEGYIADREYYRGQSSSPSLRTGAARIIDMTLVDVNAFLSFRIFLPEVVDATSSFNRPAETDVERVTALLGVDFISTTLFDTGYFSTASPVDMDAVDYSSQRPVDVLNDCAQQSGKNFFVIYDETAGSFSLFYDFNESTAYETTMQVSNVLADYDGTTTFYPLEDAVLHRDPSRVISGALVQEGSNSVYETNVETSYVYGWRDAVANSQNIKTVAQARVRAQRYLSENASEDDRLTWTCRLPAAHVNDWMAGQRSLVKFTHLPGYEEYTAVRVLQRTVKQVEATASLSDVYYEATPLESLPSGAFHAQQVGIAYSGQPLLPHATAAGDLLIAVLVGGGNTVNYPTSFGFINNPTVSPASPEVPPFPSLNGWTVNIYATTDYSGQNIGGTCGVAYQGPFHGAAGSCTAGFLVGIAWRRVLAGEESTTPVAVSTNLTNAGVGAWLWNVGNKPDPSGAAVEKDAHETGNAVTATLPTLAGNTLSVICYATGAGHGAVVQPTAMSTGTGGTLIQANAVLTNHDLPAASNVEAWAAVIQREAGGVADSSITVVGAYSGLNWCGVSIALPPGVVIPTMPYPANSVG